MFRTDSLTFAFLVQLLHRAHVLLDRAVRGTGSHVIAGGGVVRGGFHFQWTRGRLDNNITTLRGVCTEDLREEAGEHGSSDWLSVCTTRSCWVSLIDRSGRRSAERKFICTAVCDEKSCQRFSCTNVRLLLWRDRARVQTPSLFIVSSWFIRNSIGNTQDIYHHTISRVVLNQVQCRITDTGKQRRAAGLSKG